MIAAIDTWVLIAIAKGEASAGDWADLLSAERADGGLGGLLCVHPWVGTCGRTALS